eukprot:TRINITY_DN14037_c0_g1_i1.p1 TRINITY_DN14037_c0_g1~~TRINITY_DN14037_c0_g1_i1.p1  ORF type:complete len:338 (-),score=16.18 TRINITY_DN14037_c0_g1_i1:18-1031(-)
MPYEPHQLPEVLNLGDPRLHLDRPAWLCVLVPTIPRPAGEEYLLNSLHSIIEEVERGFATDPDHSVIVLVVNNDPDRMHPVFDRARSLYQDHGFVLFALNGAGGKSTVIPTGRDYSLNRPGAERPSSNVMRQSLHLRQAISGARGLAKFLLLSEDDFVSCQPPVFPGSQRANPRLEPQRRLATGGLGAVRYTIERALKEWPTFIGIRLAYGLTGVVLRDNDAQEFALYLGEHLYRRPPDHLLTEWWAGEVEPAKRYVGDRPIVAFRWTSFTHIGSESTLRGAREVKEQFPGCWSELLAPTVFEVEAFKPNECPYDDMWPCKRERRHPPESLFLPRTT